jgi:hypothetical protein
MACSGRIALEGLASPGAPGPDADKGTAMHVIAAHVLEGKSAAASDHIGNKVPVHDPGELTRTVTITEEMAQWVQSYVDSIRALTAPGDTLYVEHTVDFSHIAGIPGQQGTMDVGLVKPALRELQEHDLKTGRRPVDVVNNPQLMIYALGLLDEVELVHDIDIVRLFIHQPRVREGPSEWACSVDELRAFGQTVHDAIADSERARKELAETGMTERWARMYLNQSPSAAACAYCRAMPTCPSMLAKMESVAGSVFSDLTAPPPTLEALASRLPGLLAVDLSAAMAVTGLLEDWATAVRAEVERRLLRGDSVEGWGLELGRQGPRKWSQPQTVDEYLTNTVRLNVRQMCEVTLKSPTQLEKLAKAPTPKEKPLIGPRQWASLQKYIDRSPPKPSVKRALDIKEPYKVPMTQDVFTAIADGDNASPDTTES